uniref:Uncharacterized protein n=1 Tax=Aegilops tauschii subsp. strangulata TaxID=200361 RepID=A0A452Z8B9_AEGTS
PHTHAQLQSNLAPARGSLIGGTNFRLPQAVLDGPEEVRARRLAEHLAQLRDEPDADAGGQPRAEVLHPPQLRRQGQAPLQHPRHHHRQHSGRRPRQQHQPLAVAALRAHRHLLRPGAVRRARRQQAAAASRREPPLHAGPSVRQREAGGQQ